MRGGGVDYSSLSQSPLHHCSPLLCQGTATQLPTGRTSLHGRPLAGFQSAYQDRRARVHHIHPPRSLTRDNTEAAYFSVPSFPGRFNTSHPLCELTQSCTYVDYLPFSVLLLRPLVGISCTFKFLFWGLVFPESYLRPSPYELLGNELLTLKICKPGERNKHLPCLSYIR